MTVIAPCITVENEDLYKESVQRLLPFAERVHIDVSDGEFAPVALVTADKLFWPQEWTVDVHAMVNHPSEVVDQLIALSPHLITFHAEADEDVIPTLKKVQQAGIKAGIALQKTTVPSTVQALIEAADHCMIFSGDLGHYGGAASMMQLEKVRLIRAIKPSIEISWDGGVSLENAFSISQGGVDVLNVGGAIAKSSSPVDTYRALIREVTKQAVI